jgi:hypothetical protein
MELRWFLGVTESRRVLQLRNNEPSQGLPRTCSAVIQERHTGGRTQFAQRPQLISSQMDGVLRLTIPRAAEQRL